MSNPESKSRRKNTYLGKNMYQYAVDDSVMQAVPSFSLPTSSKGTMPGKPPPRQNIAVVKKPLEDNLEMLKIPAFVKQRPDLSHRHSTNSDHSSFNRFENGGRKYSAPTTGHYPCCTSQNDTQHSSQSNMRNKSGKRK